MGTLGLFVFIGICFIGTLSLLIIGLIKDIKAYWEKLNR